MSGLDLLFFKAAYRYNLARMAFLKAALGGRVEFGRSCDVWAGCFKYLGAGRTRIGEGTSVERGPFPLIIEVDEGGLVDIGPGAWFRGKYRPNVLTCFEGARIEIGEGSLINGAIISARLGVRLGRRVMVSWNTTIIDSNLHALENGRDMETKPVEIGDHVFVGSGVTVLPGSRIGPHTVIGAGSMVRGEVPDHVVAAGSPLKIIRAIGDRDRCL